MAIDSSNGQWQRTIAIDNRKVKIEDVALQKNYLQACALQIGDVLASRKVPRRMMSASSLED